jgi:uncharacterized membrane protein YphA (DoxX/SURF4 family)
MTAIAQPTVVTVRPGKIRNRVLWTLQIVLGLAFIFAAGLPKLLGPAEIVRMFQEIGFGQWFRYLTGVVEVSGGIGLLVPRLSGLAAAGLSITMVCAGATEVFLLHAPGSAIFPLALGALFVWIARQRGARVTR